MIQLTNLRRFVVVTALMLMALLSVSTWNAHAQEAENDKKEEAAATKKEDDKKEVEVAGVFEAARVSPIILSPKEWATLTVVEAVEHGEEVEKGDVLIRLETEKIDDAISDAEDALTTEELTLESAQIKFDLARQSQELSLAGVEKADRVSTEDLKEFIRAGRDRRIRSLDRSVKSARDQLAYQEEELKQLERMYNADDLTEETEEIILKRTRDSVDRAKYYLESAVESQKNGLKYSVPRAGEELETAMKQASLALDEANRTAHITLRQKELALAKQKLALKRNRDKLERLRNDRKLLVVRAPTSGIVYYGAAKRGKWSDPSTIAAMLVPGGSLKPKAVVMSIVRPNPLTIRAAIPEASRRHLEPGTRVSVSTVAYPDANLKGKVKSVSPIPIGDGVFDAVISVRLGDLDGKIVPGMKAKIKINNSAKKDGDRDSEHADHDDGDHDHEHADHDDGDHDDGDDDDENGDDDDEDGDDDDEDGDDDDEDGDDDDEEDGDDDDENGDDDDENGDDDDEDEDEDDDDDEDDEDDDDDDD